MKLWLMWEYIRVKLFPLYHEVGFKVWCCVIYTHAILPHLYQYHVFFFPKVNTSVLTVAFPLPINSHTLLPKVSINLCLQLTQINSDRQKPQHSSPSDSLSLHLHHFLSLYLPHFLVSCCSSTVMVCQRVTLKRLLYFYLTVFLTAGISFLNYTIKMELRAG